MDKKYEFNEAIRIISSNGLFKLIDSKYDEEQFGNSYILVESNEGIKIRAISDRDANWIEIEISGEWFFIDDLVSIMGQNLNWSRNHLHDLISDSLAWIAINAKSINEIKCSENISLRLKETAVRRVTNIFGTSNS